MPIQFKILPDKRYNIAIYTGVLTHLEIIDAWKDYYQQLWTADKRELMDLSDCDLSQVDADQLQQISRAMNVIYKQQGIEETDRIAIYAPQNFSYGISRAYEAEAFQSPEQIRVFKNLGRSPGLARTGRRRGY